MRALDEPKKSLNVDLVNKFCIAHNERLTKPRLEVLKIIAESDKPIKAYTILEQLGNVLESPKPPTAYRAIEFWVQKGFIHRIESLNAYFFCQEEYKHIGSQFLICNKCGLVLETTFCELPIMLKKNAEKNTFLPLNWSMEVYGLCEQCQL